MLGPGVTRVLSPRMARSRWGQRFPVEPLAESHKRQMVWAGGPQRSRPRHRWHFC